MNSKEIVHWLMQGCFDGRYVKCFPKATEGDVFSVFDYYTDEEIVCNIEKYEKELESERLLNSKEDE